MGRWGGWVGWVGGFDVVGVVVGVEGVKEVEVEEIGGEVGDSAGMSFWLVFVCAWVRGGGGLVGTIEVDGFWEEKISSFLGVEFLSIYLSIYRG